MNKNLLIIALSFFICCDDAMEYDGDIAFTYLEKQCDLGVRNPGSAGHQAAINMYVNFLEVLADTLILQEFEQYIAPEDVTFPMTNIIAGFNIDKGNGLLIGAHWDTRPRADHDPNPANRNKPILGANDGASGIAVLMHLAEILSRKECDRAVYLVFFDGEDYGFSGDLEYFCLGSKYFANNLPIEKPQEAIIIDMIGDADLSIPMERNSYQSHPQLAKTLWDLARKRGFKPFKHRLGEYIYDDHVPLIEADIPAVDIIDFHYPNKYINYWHTLHDTPDKCSPKSLQMIGQVLYDYIFGE